MPQIFGHDAKALGGYCRDDDINRTATTREMIMTKTLRVGLGARQAPCVCVFRFVIFFTTTAYDNFSLVFERHGTCIESNITHSLFVIYVVAFIQSACVLYVCCIIWWCIFLRSCCLAAQKETVAFYFSAVTGACAYVCAYVGVWELHSLCGLCAIWFHWWWRRCRAVCKTQSLCCTICMQIWGERVCVGVCVYVMCWSSKRRQRCARDESLRTSPQIDAYMFKQKGGGGLHTHTHH